LAGVTGGDAGAYSVVVSNRFGSTASGTAELTVVAPLSIEYLAWTENGVTVGWNGVPGLNYLLEYKDSLDNTNWTFVPPPLNARSSLLATNSPNRAPRRYYRVVLLP
jgi:hypothetical protein